VVREQVALYGTLTGATPALSSRVERPAPAAGADATAELAKVLPLQRQRAR